MDGKQYQHCRLQQHGIAAAPPLQLHMPPTHLVQQYVLVRLQLEADHHG
jgi:hypothetical protein